MSGLETKTDTGTDTSSPGPMTRGIVGNSMSG